QLLSDGLWLLASARPSGIVSPAGAPGSPLSVTTLNPGLPSSRTTPTADRSGVACGVPTSLAAAGGGAPLSVGVWLSSVTARSQAAHRSGVSLTGWPLGQWARSSSLIHSRSEERRVGK